MTSRGFCYWLQGFFELTDLGLVRKDSDQGLVSAKVKCIKKHLALVFAHEIDSYPNKDKLDAIHEKIMRCRP